MKKATFLIEPNDSINLFDWQPDKLGAVSVSPVVTAINCHADICSFMFCLPTKPETSGFRNYLWQFISSGKINLDELLEVARRTGRVSTYVHLDALANIQLSVQLFEVGTNLIGRLLTTINRITGEVTDTSFEKK